MATFLGAVTDSIESVGKNKLYGYRFSPTVQEVLHVLLVLFLVQIPAFEYECIWLPGHYIKIQNSIYLGYNHGNTVINT